MSTVRSLVCGWVLGCVLSLAPAFAGDWLHYRGPSGNGIALEECKIPASGTAPVLWRVKVGTGTSSVVVGGGKLYTMGHEGGSDVILCLDAATGDVVWTFKYTVSLDPNLFEGGPRSTPTLSGDCVYTLSHEGHLHCLDAASGTVRWQRHLVKEFGGRKPSWGYSGAPLVVGERLFVDVGAIGVSTLALNAKTGEVAWKAGSDTAGYAAPVILTLDAKPTLVLFKGQVIVGYSPEDGRELWRYPWKTEYNVNAATPLQIAPNRILISSGYNQGAAVLSIDAGQVSEVWRNKNLRCHINSPVQWGNAVFGVDGNTGGGNLVCLDPLTGEKRWEEKSVKGGGLIAAGGKLVLISEKGDLVVAQASGEGF
ncbi:MAG: PQQ-binding-like beta-propeller repeat protein, partial [Verrucomicrobiota bacterium]